MSANEITTYLKYANLQMAADELKGSASINFRLNEQNANPKKCARQPDERILAG